MLYSEKNGHIYDSVYVKVQMTQLIGCTLFIVSLIYFYLHRDLIKVIIPNEERQTKVDLLLDAYGLLARRDLYRATLTMTHTAIWFLRSLSIIGGQVIYSPCATRKEY